MLRVWLNRTATVLSTVITLLGSLLHGAPASAQTNYQPYVLGLRTAGMGGASVAFGRDSAAPWLNPAGVASQHQQIALSANAGLLQLESAPGFLALSPDTDVQPSIESPSERQSADFSVFPSSLLYTLPIGGHTVGLSVITPYQDAVSEFTTFSYDLGAGPSRSELWTTQSQLRLNNFGVVYGYDFGKVRVGASAFFRYSNFQVIANETSIFYTLANGRVGFSTFTNSSDAVSFDIDLIAGVQVGPFGGFSAGLTVQAPSIHLGGDWDSIVTIFEGDSDTDMLGYADSQIRDGDFKALLPLTVRAGIGYEDPKVFAVAADVAFHIPTGEYERFTGIRDSRIIASEPERSSLPPPQDVVLVADRDLVINANVGAEVWLTKRLALRGGFFTDFSARKELPPLLERTIDNVESSRLDRFGGTLGVGFQGKLSQSQLTAVYAYGDGEIIGIEYNFNPEEASQLPDVGFRTHTFLLVFSGAIDPSAIADAAMQAIREEAMPEMIPEPEETPSDDCDDNDDCI